MVESYLEDGAQGLGEHVYGKSITDPCLGWEKTEQLIFDIADKLQCEWAEDVLKITTMNNYLRRVENETEHKVLLSLDDRMLQTPSFAIQATMSEVGHMGEVVKCFRDCGGHLIVNYTFG